MDNQPDNPQLEEKQIAHYYRQQQEIDFTHAIDKRRQYGSADLRVMAAAMREMLPEPSADALAAAGYPADCDQAEAYYVEAAIAFYQLGKVSRIVGALAEGIVPNADSWVDSTIYSMMARCVRHRGGW